MSIRLSRSLLRAPPVLACFALLKGVLDSCDLTEPAYYLCAPEEAGILKVHARGSQYLKRVHERKPVS